MMTMIIIVVKTTPPNMDRKDYDKYNDKENNNSNKKQQEYKQKRHKNESDDLNFQKCNLKGHKSQRSQGSKIALRGCSSMVIVNVYFGHVMSPHPSDKMSQRSEVSRGALWYRCLCVEIVFVFVFLLVKSCLLIFLIKCLKDHEGGGPKKLLF